MASLEDLPDVAEWDPSPEEESDLRERLLRAGEARAGTAPTTGGLEDEARATTRRSRATPPTRRRKALRRRLTRRRARRRERPSSGDPPPA